MTLSTESDHRRELWLLREARRCLERSLKTSELRELVDRLVKRIYNPLTRRKTIYEHLQQIPPLEGPFNLAEAELLESKEEVLVVTENPLTVVITPSGLLRLLVEDQPEELQEIQRYLFQRLEEVVLGKTRSTVSAFRPSPLKLQEVAALLFLLYNNSTSPSRGSYEKNTELWQAIDSTVQAFVKDDSESSATPNLDGAPDGWYLSEANRKLRNAIEKGNGVYYVKPRRHEEVAEAIRAFTATQPSVDARRRFASFEESFKKIEGVLLKTGAYYYSRANRDRIAKWFEGNGEG